MPVAETVVVLVEPSHPGNIGATARAMKNMGLARLRLVRPASFPSAEASALASGATDILAEAEVYTAMDAALGDASWVVGTTARQRELHVPVQTPEATAVDLQSKERAGQRSALIFGRESDGLNNQELDRCNALVRIPTAETYASLNLAQAVQVMAYVLHRVGEGSEAGNGDGFQHTALEGGSGATLPAGGGVTEGLFGHFERVIRDIGFLRPGSEQRTYRRLRRLVLRARPSESEVRFLRGILSAVEKRVHGPTPRRDREDGQT